MWHDVRALEAFYQQPLGQSAAQRIHARINAIWPDVKAMRLGGIGYPAPYLGEWTSDCERTIAIMPGFQGVHHWSHQEDPSQEKRADNRQKRNCAVLVDETRLPFPDKFFDRLLIVHMLEHSRVPQVFLDECWRVMSDGGRLLIIVPARRGLWSRSDSTPFGHGSPFSRNQLEIMLRAQRFLPLQFSRALYFPPVSRPAFLKLAPMIDRALSRLCHRLGGILLVEAEKRLFIPYMPAKASGRLSIPVQLGLSPQAAGRVLRPQAVVHQSPSAAGLPAGQERYRPTT